MLKHKLLIFRVKPVLSAYLHMISEKLACANRNMQLNGVFLNVF